MIDVIWEWEGREKGKRNYRIIFLFFICFAGTPVKGTKSWMIYKILSILDFSKVEAEWGIK